MKIKSLIILLLVSGIAQANLEATYRNNLLINPNTNQPYTGNLDVLNNDWGKDAVEFNRDYVDGIIQGTEKCSGLTNCSGPLNLDTFQATFSNSAIF